MKRHVVLLVVGLLLIVIGVVLAVAVPLMTYKDPADAALKTLDYGIGGGTEPVQLDKGTYEVWGLIDLISFNGEVTITDGSGDTVFSSSGSESTTSVNGKARLGSFDADGGSYNVSCNNHATVYITEPINVGGILGGICGGLLVAGIGGVVTVVGFISWLSSRKGQQQAAYAQQPPPGYPPQQYPAPGYPQQQYPAPGYPQQPSPQQPYPPPQQPPQHPPSSPPPQ
jgi:hypothetical protein